MFAGKSGRVLWVIMMGIMAISALSIAVINTKNSLSMEPVELTLPVDTDLESMAKKAKSNDYFLGTTLVDITFEDGKQLKRDVMLENYEIQRMLSTKKLDVYYDEKYPKAVFSEHDKPSVLGWWIFSFCALGVFIFAIKLLRNE